MSIAGCEGIPDYSSYISVSSRRSRAAIAGSSWQLEPILEEMVSDGLVTLEKVRVLKYKPGAPRK